MNSAGTTTTTPHRPSSRTRLSVYVGALVLVPVAAFFFGMTRFEATACSGPDSGDCDLGGLAGSMWAGSALVLVVIAVGVTEFVLSHQRRT